LWTAPSAPLAPGTSIAQNTFTAAKDLPVGEFATNFPIIYGGTLSPGSHIQIEAWGVASNTGTPTLALGIYWGLVAGTAIAVSTAKTTTTAMTNWEWHLWYTSRIIGVGTATTGGSIVGSGYWNLPTSLTAWTQIRLPETAPAAVAIDTTINKQISIGATWGTSSISNTITCHECLVEVHG
jgi:hypothetical protein